MLETIITEASFFFFLGFLSQTFTINRTIGQEGDQFFNSSWGTNYFGQRICGEAALNKRTNNDQFMPRWGMEEFLK